MANAESDAVTVARLFVGETLAAGAEILLDADRAHYLRNVLRLKSGDAIALFNGRDGEWRARIASFGRRDARLTVATPSRPQRAAPDLWLAFAPIKRQRVDWLVEKATELGVASIQPVTAARSVLRLKGERADKKIAHWRGIAIAACEQCGRNRVPVIHELLDFADWAASLRAQAADTPGARLLLSLRPASLALSQALPATGAVTLLNGPEGGLSPAEEEAALAGGFVPVSLGPRVLRAETAPIAALAALTLQP